MSFQDQATALIKRHEGFREKPYYCSEGFLTVGYGTNLDAGISESQATMLMGSAMKHVIERLEFQTWWDNCNDARKAALVDMGYQLGVAGLLKFSRMIAAIRISDWELAAKEALDSRWAKQTRNRANTIAEIIRTGEINV